MQGMRVKGKGKGNDTACTCGGSNIRQNMDI